MKKLIILLALLSVAAGAAPLSMKVGEKKQLAATGKTAGAPMDWISTDMRVATVINSADSKLNGMVVARHAGTATIVASDHSETTVTVTEAAKTEKKK